MAEPRRRWNVAEISGDKLEPVDRILLITQSLTKIAEQRIVATKIEFNNLARCQWDPDSEDAKSFYFLRWEREALRKFVEITTSAYRSLHNETQNVWHTTYLDRWEEAENSTTVPIETSEISDLSD